MADVIGQGLTWLNDQRHRHMTRPVVYCRGSVEVGLDATPGRSQFEEFDESGIATRTESRDFIVRTQDLVLAGDAATPREGDRIAAAGELFEVVSPAGEPPFAFTDSSRSSIRIHTRHVGGVGVVGVVGAAS